MFIKSKNHWKKILIESEEQLLSSYCTAPDIKYEVYDTPIPGFTALPTKKSRSCCPPSSTKKENIESTSSLKNTLFMHTIKVQCTAALQQERDESTLQQPLVLVHGWVSASMSFYRNLKGLARQFGTVYAVDMLGWGLSSRLSSSSSALESDQHVEDFFVESLEEWRRQQEFIMSQNNKDDNNNNNKNDSNTIPSMILAGHSLGGYITTCYAEQYPQHVERLVLMVPAGVQSQELQDQLQQQEQETTTTKKQKTGQQTMTQSTLEMLWNRGISLEHIIYMLPTFQAKKIINNVFGDYMSTEERQFLTDYMYANVVLMGSPGIAKLFYLNSVARRPLLNRIPQLSISHVSFLYAERDTWMKMEYGRAVQTICNDNNKAKNNNCAPNVEIFSVRDAGHALMWKHPNEFNDKLAQAAGKKKSQTFIFED